MNNPQPEKCEHEWTHELDEGLKLAKGFLRCKKCGDIKGPGSYETTTIFKTPQPKKKDCKHYNSIGNITEEGWVGHKCLDCGCVSVDYKLKPNQEWEKEFDKKFEAYEEEGHFSTMISENVRPLLKSFIHDLLLAQKQKILEMCEEMKKEVSESNDFGEMWDEVGELGYNQALSDLRSKIESNI